jgi:F0F1-type ATP synthase epsilon subunit
VSERTLRLVVVTPDGEVLHESGVDAVVFRRSEARFAEGSEVAVFPLHAPTLIRLPISPARYRRGDRTVHLALDGGFAEVDRGRVLVVTPRCERVRAAERDPARRARELCRAWRGEARSFRDAMIGYR